MGSARKMSAALLLSGGMDSLSICYWMRPDIAITINYGQKAALGEIRSSVAICEELEIPHILLNADCSMYGSGDMAWRAPSKLAPASDWWPYRNQYLITVAAMWLAQNPIDQLVIGTVASDRTHLDGTVEFIDALSKTLSIQEGSLKLVAPAIDLTTPDLVRKSEIPFTLLALSHSCHISDFACGRCRGCNKHYQSMVELGYDAY
jgi:7-cyano-7-deazaguanine synthase